MIRWRRVPLARRNLVHHPGRLMVRLAGLVFAVLLMFMQMGFWHALFDSTVRLLQVLDADIVLASRGKYAMLAPETIALRDMRLAEGCRGVKSVHPLYSECFRAIWKTPHTKGNAIRVVAYHPEALVFDDRQIKAAEPLLRNPNTALIDCRSKPCYGVTMTDKTVVGLQDAQLAGRSIRLVGMFSLGTDFTNDGTLVMSADNYARYFPDGPADHALDAVSLGIAKVESNEDPSEVCRRLAAMLPKNIAAYTKQEWIEHEKTFWSNSTPIGIVFFTGTVIGFIVGMVICYHIIYSDIADHMREFATLKAMGYRNGYFVGFVLKTSLYLSLLSFLPGWLISLKAYHELASSTGLLMDLSPARAATVFLLTVAMCVTSGLLAMQKFLAAEPANLF